MLGREIPWVSSDWHATREIQLKTWRKCLEAPSDWVLTLRWIFSSENVVITRQHCGSCSLNKCLDQWRPVDKFNRSIPNIWYHKNYSVVKPLMTPVVCFKPYLASPWHPPCNEDASSCAFVVQPPLSYHSFVFQKGKQYIAYLLTRVNGPWGLFKLGHHSVIEHVFACHSLRHCPHFRHDDYQK